MQTDIPFNNVSEIPGSLTCCKEEECNITDMSHKKQVCIERVAPDHLAHLAVWSENYTVRYLLKQRCINLTADSVAFR